MGFIFAAIGSAVGLGNIWRFPMSVQENGGGAYLIPYLAVTFVFGLSLMVVEISTGAKFGTNIVSTFRKLKSGYLGLFVAGVSVVVISYYLVITGWVLGFTWHFLTNTPISFEGFTSGVTPLLFFVVSLVVTAGIIASGVQDGIEKAVSIFIPLIFLTLVGLVIYSATLPGFTKGVGYFLEPDFSVLGNPGIWDNAFGQAFFSLSIGQALLFTYGTYLDDEEGLIKTSVIITVSNFFVAFLVGLVIFPLVFTFGSGTSTLGSGRQLAFVTLPKMFYGMAEPWGMVLGTVFFALLFIAALSSALAYVEVPVSVLIGRGASRQRATTVVFALLLVTGFPAALSYAGSPGLTLFGERIFDVMNDAAGNYLLPLSGLVTAVGFTWYSKDKVGKSDFVYYITKYALPVALTVVILGKIYSVL